MQAYTGGIPAGSGLFRLQFLTLLLLQELRVVRPCACVCTGLCACGCINTRGRLIFSLLLFPITPLPLPPINPPLPPLSHFIHTNTRTRTHVHTFVPSARILAISIGLRLVAKTFSQTLACLAIETVCIMVSRVCVCVCVCDCALHVHIYK